MYPALHQHGNPTDFFMVKIEFKSYKVDFFDIKLRFKALRIHSVREKID